MADLASIFGLIESGNPNPLSAWDFQQGMPFQTQFGGGAGGFENWLGQAISANPNLTLGDAYAQYNAGTGTPGFGTSWDRLALINPAAYANASRKIAAAGLSPSSLVSGLTGGIDITGAQYDQYGNPYLSQSQADKGQGTPTPTSSPFWQGAVDTLTSFFGRFVFVAIGGMLIFGAFLLMAGDKARSAVVKGVVG